MARPWREHDPQAERILQAGQADLIAIGREVLVDDHWALHMAGGWRYANG
jgi:2,4-dienoyl-CoA reductase-like NADH-dependent reductase (Old Yellow Enzyme family)